MTTRVTLIPGDGIGPSIADAAVRALEVAGSDPPGEHAGHRGPLVAGARVIDAGGTHPVTRRGRRGVIVAGSMSGGGGRLR